MKKFMIILITIVLIILLGAGFAFTFLYDKYSYSTERADLQEYYGLENEEQVAIVLQDELLTDKAILRDGIYYLDLNTIHTYFNERFYLDNSVVDEALLIYTTTEKNYRVKQNETSISSEDGTEELGYAIMLYENDICYVAIDYVVRFTDMTYEVFTEPNRMQIYNAWPGKTEGTIKKDTQVRYRGGVKSEILTDVTKGEKVTILEELDSWYKVKTDDAYIGYLQKRFVKNVVSYVEDRIATVEPIYYPAREIDNRINMGWHQVLSYVANDNVASVVAGTNINVIAPTWFLLSGNEGAFVNNASHNYVHYAHNQGIDVWAVIDNFNLECDLHEILKSTKQRDNLVAKLVSDCKAYGIDGINVDFEQVDPKTESHYIQFIRELSVACHDNDLVVSVDNYVPTAYTAFYNREEQGRYVDYVVIMAYDEHAGNSDVAGSVASIGFVEQGIVDTIEMVEADKIINGIPFYTRGWVTENGETDAVTLTMGGQNQFITSYGIEVEWDETTGQYYGESNVNDVLYQIWMEEDESLQKKLDIMNKYDVAGVAQWKLGLETGDVWGIIGNYVNQ